MLNIDEDERESIIWNFRFLYKKLAPEIITYENHRRCKLIGNENDDIYLDTYFLDMLTEKFASIISSIHELLCHISGRPGGKEISSAVKNIGLDNEWMFSTIYYSFKHKNDDKIETIIECSLRENLLIFLRKLLLNLLRIFPDEIIKLKNEFKDVIGLDLETEMKFDNILF